MNTNLITLSSNLLIEQCIYLQEGRLVYVTRIIDKEGHLLDLTTYPSLGAMYRATKEIEMNLKKQDLKKDVANEIVQEIAKYLELKECGLSDSEIEQSRTWQDK